MPQRLPPALALLTGMEDDGLWGTEASSGSHLEEDEDEDKRHSHDELLPPKLVHIADVLLHVVLTRGRECYSHPLPQRASPGDKDKRLPAIASRSPLRWGSLGCT